MQPISILGPGTGDLAAAITQRLDGRVAVVTRDTDGGALESGNSHNPYTEADECTDGGTAHEITHRATADRDEPTTDRTLNQDVTTTITLSAEGSWTGSGVVDGFDDLLDDLAPDHDYLVAVGYTRLRVPTVLVGTDQDPDAVPGTVIRQVEDPSTLDIEDLCATIDDAEPWITLTELVEQVHTAPGTDQSGAIATFTGRVRATDGPDDDRTTHLAFEKYEGVAQKRMDLISAELADREGVFDVRMHHRTGVIEAGEDIVFVVVLAGHRTEAFQTVEDGINRLKDEVPIFKKEATEVEEFWVHQRD